MQRVLLAVLVAATFSISLSGSFNSASAKDPAANEIKMQEKAQTNAQAAAGDQQQAANEAAEGHKLRAKRHEKRAEREEKKAVKAEGNAAKDQVEAAAKGAR